MIKLIKYNEIDNYAEQIKNVYELAFNYSKEDSEFLLQRIKNSFDNNLNTVILVYIENEEVVGFVFGFDFHVNNWWAKQIHSRLPLNRNWYDNTFELNELAVLPKKQNQGLGRKLMLNLIETINNKLILLSTAQNNNEKVINFYHSLGFVNLIEDFQYENLAYGKSIIMSREEYL